MTNLSVVGMVNSCPARIKFNYEKDRLKKARCRVIVLLICFAMSFAFNWGPTANSVFGFLLCVYLMCCIPDKNGKLK